MPFEEFSLRTHGELASSLGGLRLRLGRVARDLARWDAVEAAGKAGGDLAERLPRPRRPRAALLRLRDEIRAALAVVEVQLDQTPERRRN